MLSRRRFVIGAGAILGLARLRAAGGTPSTSPVVPASGAPGRELIRDPGFRSGFALLAPKPGKRVVYGRLRGGDGEAVEPAWELAQWSSRFPLPVAAAVCPAPGIRRWANAAKEITVGEPGTPAADLVLGVNTVVEYPRRARRAGEPWVHLLVEQQFIRPPSLAALTTARLRLQARLLKAEHHRTEDYSPALHAAQFQLFLTVQNRNRQSPGFGDFVWFGIPLFDDRTRFPREHKARDTAGSGKFIFTPAGEVFADRSAHDGEWITVDRQLRPLLWEALATARQNGFLPASESPADYHLVGMNLGWEVPGRFEVAMQVRGLSLAVETG